jgi:hypothetical protein
MRLAGLGEARQLERAAALEPAAQEVGDRVSPSERPRHPRTEVLRPAHLGLEERDQPLGPALAKRTESVGHLFKTERHRGR